MRRQACKAWAYTRWGCGGRGGEKQTQFLRRPEVWRTHPIPRLRRRRSNYYLCIYCLLFVIINDVSGDYEIIMELPRGQHEIKFIINGETWRTHPDLEARKDTQGNQNNVIVVDTVARPSSSAPGAAAHREDDEVCDIQVYIGTWLSSSRAHMAPKATAPDHMQVSLAAVPSSLLLWLQACCCGIKV